MRKFKLALAVASLLLFGGVTLASIVCVLQNQSRQQAVASIREAIRDGRYVAALEQAQQMLDDTPETYDIRWLAIRAAFGAKRPQQATSLLGVLFSTRRNRDELGKRLMELIRSLLDEGCVEDAEPLLRRAVTIRSVAAPALRSLVDLYVVEGRWEAARRLIYQLLAAGQHRPHDLVFLIDPGTMPLSSTQRALRTAAAEHSTWELARARRAAARGDWQTARVQLERLLVDHPHLPEVAGLYGRVLAELEDRPAFDRWRAAIDERTLTDPDGWLALAKDAELRGEIPQAVRAYWETLRHRPDDPVALSRLAERLHSIEPEAAAAYRQRQQAVQNLIAAAHQSWQAPQDLVALRRLAAECEAMGRYWEAWGWQSEVARRDPTDVTADERLRRLRRQLADDLPPIVEKQDVARRYRLSQFPLPGRETTSPVSLTP